jgi:hypothetical protein
MRDDLPEIKAALQAQIETVCRHLLPGGRRSGNYWMARNPARDDKHIGSFWVSLRGGAAGAWRDEATGDKGDVLGLICHCQSTDLRGALAWARDWLRLQPPAPIVRREEAKERADDDADLGKKRRQAMAVWLDAETPILSTLADVYLRSRGIDLERFARLPRALRFSPAQRHYESGRLWPCLVAAMTAADGSFAAIHRTFLSDDGRGKAPVEPVRKMWPSYRGAAIHLWRGETGLPVRQAAEQGLWDRLALVEGIEDGLALALACPELRVWVVGSLSNLGAQALPQCCGEVIVCADNDWGKPGAERQLERALDNLGSQGRPVKVARATIGKDVNDELRGAA